MSTNVLNLPGGRTSLFASIQLRRRSLGQSLLVLAILLVAGGAHSINMFHYPYFEDDEGTYMSQAYAVVHLGHLAAYTYWYDHAPLGWLQIAGWTVVAEATGLGRDGIASGRVLMLVLQLGSVLITYLIARSLTSSTWAAVLAAFCFALSSYGLYFHRRVLLDNIATFWMLVSILLLVAGRFSLKRAWLSAAALGASFLSKEVTVVLVPAMALLVAYRADPVHRWIAVSGWLILVLSIGSFYPLMAILNGELFPAHTLLGGDQPHVSLLCTLQYQAARGRDGGLLDLQSNFWRQARDWYQEEPILVVAGTLSTFGCVVSFPKDRRIVLLACCTLSLWVFLGRGGELIRFYFIPLLPLLAINLAVFGSMVVRLTGRIPRETMRRPAIACGVATIYAGCLTGLWLGYQQSNLDFGTDRLALWDARQVDAQTQAVTWVQHELPLNSRIVIDQYMWMDLHASTQGRARFDRAHYYWKVADDPAISYGVLGNDWRNIDYVITTPQLTYDARTQNLNLVADALSHSQPVATFNTGGWPVEIRKVDVGTKASDFNVPGAVPGGLRATPETGGGACLTKQR